MASDAAPSDAAADFLAAYGPLFGINSPSQELSIKRQKSADRGRSFVRYQQVHKNVPVLGGELIVQMDAAKKVISVHGEVSPDLSMDVTPAIAPAAATAAAIGLVGKHYNVETGGLTSTTPELWIYNPALLGHDLNENILVWRIEVRTDSMSDLNELVLVDAKEGFIALHYNQTPHEKNRSIYDNQNLPAQTDILPGLGPVRTEGQAAASITDVDHAYDYMGYTYDFYWTYHGRDSIDNAGLPLKATVRHCQSGYPCPTPNAFWNPQAGQMVFGDSYTSALDIVGHELTHGVTSFESNLFYYMQSGAINESLSDVWGEIIQQTYEPPPPANRWLVGEILSSGASRSLSDPPSLNKPEQGIYYPDRMTSPNYRCWSDLDGFSGNDNGGVHFNSGVGNKAAYLMVDGGSFNGMTVTAIGIMKTAKVYYEAQTSLLTSGSDYADLYDVLQLACSNLLGTSGITLSDCQQVKNAVDAVEMNLQPASCAASQAPICPDGLTLQDVFFDNFEAGGGNWGVGGSANVWYLYDGYAADGTWSLWGLDQGVLTDAYVSNASAVPIPPGAYLHFNHAYDFEYEYINGYRYFDGGLLEYSSDGGAWQDAGPLFIDNGYDGSIASGHGNPLAGRPAFGGISNGYISSRLDLSSLTGRDVQFRFRIGTDSSYSALGWFVDDVRIYRCLSLASITIATVPSGRDITVDGTPHTAPRTFTWEVGSSHTIDVASPQSGTTGTRHVFFSWSDGGEQSHTITTPASATTFTANFATQYQLTTSVTPPGSGSVAPDCTGGCWHDSGSAVSLSPIPSGSSTFSSWTGDINSLDAPLSLTMSGPKNVAANFDSTVTTYTVRIAGTPPAYYTSIPLAYTAAVNSDVIQTQATSYGGALVFDRTDIPGLSITLKGGYNSSYSDNTGLTTVGSPVTIQGGTIIVDKIVIQ